MTRGSGLDGGTLSQWLEDEGIVPAVSGPGTIADVARVRALLVAASRERRVVSYSEALRDLGHRFTRPKMRALCKTLDAIDANAPAGEPELAVLVVRESDRLPGQGWWIGVAERYGYTGAWEGPEAVALVRALQARTLLVWPLTTAARRLTTKLPCDVDQPSAAIFAFDTRQVSAFRLYLCEWFQGS